MSDPYGSARLYQTQYDEAYQLLEKGDMEGSLKAAKYNLT